LAIGVVLIKNDGQPERMSRDVAMGFALTTRRFPAGCYRPALAPARTGSLVSMVYSQLKGVKYAPMLSRAVAQAVS
jgi:hypothetical protein